jgi:hypothetical protein
MGDKIDFAMGNIVMAATDKPDVKSLFMASPYIEWTKFAESLGWNPQRSRSDYPVSTWVDEKKKVLAQARAKKLAGMLLSHDFRLHKQVLSTLRRYPSAIDKLFNVINKRVANLAADGSVDGMSTKELLKLTQALKHVTEAKYNSLLIDRWSFELADKLSGKASDPHTAKDFLQINIEGRDIGIKDVQNLMDQYYGFFTLGSGKRSVKVMGMN